MPPKHAAESSNDTTTTGRSNADGDPTNGCEVSCPEVAHGLCVHCGGDAFMKIHGKNMEKKIRRDPETNGRSTGGG